MTTTAATTITQGPTLTNPEKLTTDELRAELHRANAQLLDLSMQVHQLHQGLQGMGKDIGRIVLMRLQGNTPAVLQILDEIIKSNVTIASPQSTATH